MESAALQNVLLSPQRPAVPPSPSTAPSRHHQHQSQQLQQQSSSSHVRITYASRYLVRKVQMDQPSIVREQSSSGPVAAAAAVASAGASLLTPIAEKRHPSLPQQQQPFSSSSYCHPSAQEEEAASFEAEQRNRQHEEAAGGVDPCLPSEPHHQHHHHSCDTTTDRDDEDPVVAERGASPPSPERAERPSTAPHRGSEILPTADPRTTAVATHPTSRGADFHDAQLWQEHDVVLAEVRDRRALRREEQQAFFFLVCDSEARLSLPSMGAVPFGHASSATRRLQLCSDLFEDVVREESVHRSFLQGADEATERAALLKQHLSGLRVLKGIGALERALVKYALRRRATKTFASLRLQRHQQTESRCRAQLWEEERAEWQELVPPMLVWEEQCARSARTTAWLACQITTAWSYLWQSQRVELFPLLYGQPLVRAPKVTGRIAPYTRFFMLSELETSSRQHVEALRLEGLAGIQAAIEAVGLVGTDEPCARAQLEADREVQLRHLWQTRQRAMERYWESECRQEEAAERAMIERDWSKSHNSWFKQLTAAQ